MPAANKEATGANESRQCLPPITRRNKNLEVRKVREKRGAYHSKDKVRPGRASSKRKKPRMVKTVPNMGKMHPAHSAKVLNL